MAVLGGMGNCDLKREERYLVSTKQHETWGMGDVWEIAYCPNEL